MKLEQMMEPYQPEIERAMKKYYATLSEKDQRRYAAVEALKLGLGGKSYICGTNQFFASLFASALSSL